MEIKEFLLARIAEDEEVASAAVGTAAFQKQTGRWSFEHPVIDLYTMPLVFALADGGGKTQVARLDAAWEREQRGQHIARFDPARVLAECEAKRRIVEEHRPVQQDGETCCAGCGWSPLYGGPFRRNRIEECPTLRALALPYADHPDYPEEWKLS